MKKLLLIFGTRPEAIKFAPLIKKLQSYPQHFEVKTCTTGQHKTMLKQVLDFFGIEPDFELDTMVPDQTLFDISANVLLALKEVFDKKYDPEYVIVQGDTTTAMIGALSAFYHKKKVIHLEAGLRSHNKYSPFPEEMNRILVGKLADLHLAPTNTAVRQLLQEGVPEHRILLSGNTVIDALLAGLEIIKNSKEAAYQKKFAFIQEDKKNILVTGHRRENFGTPFRNICSAIQQIASRNPDVSIVYPVHLNPSVQKPVTEMLSAFPNVHLIEPLEYDKLIWLMSRSYIILTDSGGIQEEGPSLGKPVLVMREVTERMEGVEAGTARLVGTDTNVIINEVTRLLNDTDAYNQMANAVNPYGDGKASERIAKFLIQNSL